MQIGLDELLSMLLSRVDELSIDNENAKSRFNIMFRMLYNKGLFTEQDALDALIAENKILMDLGMIKAMPDENALKNAAHNLMIWIKGDIEEIKLSLDEINQRPQQEPQKRSTPKIETASAAVLNELDRISSTNRKKLIL